MQAWKCFCTLSRCLPGTALQREPPQGSAHTLARNTPIPDQLPQGHPDLQEPAASIQLLEVCPVEGGAVQCSPLREHSLHVGSPGEFLVMHEEWDPVSTGKGAEREAVLQAVCLLSLPWHFYPLPATLLG